MKKFLLILAAFSIALVTMAQPPKGPAKPGMTFGKKTTAKNAITVGDLVGTTTEHPLKVKVKGKVVDVCTQQGCWLRLQTPDGNMMVKMKDHSFFVPVDINGKDIVVDGVAKLKTTSVKELQHYAEDAGKTKEEIEAIKMPKKEIVLNANGILVI